MRRRAGAVTFSDVTTPANTSTRFTLTRTTSLWRLTFSNRLTEYELLICATESDGPLDAARDQNVVGENVHADDRGGFARSPHLDRLLGTRDRVL